MNCSCIGTERQNGKCVSCAHTVNVPYAHDAYFKKFERVCEEIGRMQAVALKNEMQTDSPLFRSFWDTRFRICHSILPATRSLHTRAVFYFSGQRFLMLEKCEGIENRDSHIDKYVGINGQTNGQKKMAIESLSRPQKDCFFIH